MNAGAIMDLYIVQVIFEKSFKIVWTFKWVQSKMIFKYHE